MLTRTVTSGGVSSLLLLTGLKELQAYPESSLGWPPVLYCIGWSTVLVCRLIIAACCDVHRHDEDNDTTTTATLPFV